MTEKELEELEIYLENEDNNEIYFELLNTDYKGVIRAFRVLQIVLFTTGIYQRKQKQTFICY